MELLSVPRELWWCAFDTLDVKSLSVFSQTCRTAFELVNSHLRIWKEKLEEVKSSIPQRIPASQEGSWDRAFCELIPSLYLLLFPEKRREIESQSPPVTAKIQQQLVFGRRWMQMRLEENHWWMIMRLLDEFSRVVLPQLRTGIVKYNSEGWKTTEMDMYLKRLALVERKPYLVFIATAYFAIPRTSLPGSMQSKTKHNAPQHTNTTQHTTYNNAIAHYIQHHTMQQRNTTHNTQQYNNNTTPHST